MSESKVIDGSILWVGEHWIARLRRTGDTSDCSLVSLYHTDYSPAGAGHVAIVSIDGKDGFDATGTDNPELARYINNIFIQGKTVHSKTELSNVVDAEFRFSGDIRHSPMWSIRSCDTQIMTNWTKLQPPVIAFRPDVEVQRRRAVFNILFFAEAATITLDGIHVDGAAYSNSIWNSNIGGGDRSSCVVALAEAFVTPN